ncbi:MAG: outer-membrane lipoprotein carrier protein LolA [Gemmatimonadales bacterium]|nr:outer-membrane lipoprotein carrier protein LolA [Gemmatimonadales bacterium]
MRAVRLVPTLLAALALAAPAHAQDAGEVIGRAARVYRDAGTIRADFTQVIDDRMVGTFESRGTLVQGQEGRLAMRFTDPKGDAIIVDGTSIWVYTPSTTPGQVLRLGVQASPVYGANLLERLLDRPAERYRTRYIRSDVLNGRPADVVELVPLVPDMPFTKAVLWLDTADALPRRLEFSERSGARRTLTLSRVRPNQGAPASTFRFDVPSGVRVVTQ